MVFTLAYYAKATTAADEEGRSGNLFLQFSPLSPLKKIGLRPQPDCCK